MSRMLDDLYSDIADAIRDKEVSENEIKASDFAERILALQTKKNASTYPLVIHSTKGAAITATQGDTTVSGLVGGGGTVTLWLPSPGTWSVVATKGSYSSSAINIDISGRAELVIPDVLKASSKTVANLSQRRGKMADAICNTTLLLAGGWSFWGGEDEQSTVDTYTANLVHGTATSLSETKYDPRGAKVGNGAIIAGGNINGSTRSVVVEGFNSSLTKSTLASLSSKRLWPQSGSVGNYGMVSGGYDSTESTTCEVYNTSFTKSNTLTMNVGRSRHQSTMAGNYLIFGPGTVGSMIASTEAFNSSLTKLTSPNISTPKNWTVAASTSSHAIFAGGYTGSFVTTADAIDSNLTRKTIEDLYYARCNDEGMRCGTKLGEYAVFVGSKYIDAIEVYDNHLSHSEQGCKLTKSGNREYPSVLTLNNTYVIVAGSDYSGTLELFEKA